MLLYAQIHAIMAAGYSRAYIGTSALGIDAEIPCCWVLAEGSTLKLTVVVRWVS